MRKSILFIILYLLFTYIGISQEQTKKVLFLGNSYTAVNNLPEMVSDMAESTGDVLIYDSYTPGGYRFLNHAADQTALNKINAQDWDFVVLQGQSQETAFPDYMLEAEIYPVAAELVDAIRANNPCSRPLFYMTWGRKNGDPMNCPHAPWFCEYETMDDAIYDTYVFMAEDNHAEVAPAGAVWRYLRENNPDIELYSSDESHPSLAGSYAAAVAFYTMIFDKNPSDISWNSILNETTAQSIRTAAQNVVYDALSDWDFRAKPLAQFSETMDELTVNFTNQSENYESLFWDFGDGHTSEEENPSHSYPESGTYTVILTTEKCGMTHEFSKDVNVEDLGADKFSSIGIRIYPNPTDRVLYLQNTENLQIDALAIYDLQGKLYSEHPGSTTEIEVSELASGIYFLRVEWNGEFGYLRFVKR